jgi:hypothetical protein
MTAVKSLSHISTQIEDGCQEGRADSVNFQGILRQKKITGIFSSAELGDRSL